MDEERVDKVTKDWEEEVVVEAVVLLLTMGIARAELASAATTTENEARILSSVTTKYRETGLLDRCWTGSEGGKGK